MTCTSPIFGNSSSVKIKEEENMEWQIANQTKKQFIFLYLNKNIFSLIKN